MRTCTGCFQDLNLDQFHGNSKGGLKSRCKKCLVKQSVEANRRTRRNLLEALGNECVDCGFCDPRALQVDHVYGDGKIERKITKDPWMRYRRMLKEVQQGSDRYQILCANCNWIKRSENHEL